MEEKEIPYMKVGALKEMLKNVDDDTEVYIRCCVNICGNIVNAGIADKSSYGFFGTDVPCIIIEPADSSYAVKRR